MKRLAMLLCVAVMTIGSITTVFAQPSVDVDGVIKIESAKSNDGNDVEIRLKNLTGNIKKSADKITQPDNLKKLLGNAYSSGMKVIQMGDLYIWDSEKGEVSYSESKKLFPVTIKFNAPGVADGSKVTVLRYVDGEWVVDDSVYAGNNVVTAKFNKLTPVIFLVDNGNVSAGNGGGQNNEIISPKTGATDMVMWAALFAVAGFAVAVLSYNKKRA